MFSWGLKGIMLIISPAYICALACVPLLPTSRANVLYEDHRELCMDGGSSALPANVSKEQIIKSV